MKEQELFDLKRKLEKAEKLKQSISNIDKILDKINKLSSKCERIDFKYYGESDGGFGFETGEWVNMGLSITPETLGMSEEDYHQCFSKPLINHLKEIRNEIQKNFNKLS